MEGVNILKIVAVIVLFFIALGAGMAPVLIKSCAKSVNFLGIANAFAGGVFLAISLLHVLPEAVEAYAHYVDPHDHRRLSVRRLEDHDHSHGWETFPYLMYFAGYFLILMVDKVIFDTHSSGGHGHGHGHADPVNRSFVANARKSVSRSQAQKINYSENQSNQPMMGDPVVEDIDNNQIEETVKGYISKNEKFSVRMSHAIIPDGTNKPQKCGISAVILMIALSAHSLFEGIATGLASDIDGVANFLIAIALHKWAAAMSLGISLKRNFEGQVKTIFYLLLVFSLATPFGVILGMIIHNAANPLMDVIFNTLAGGTFIYIACSEVIVEEFSVGKNKWWKALFFLIGAGMIVSLGLLEGHDHSH